MVFTHYATLPLALFVPRRQRFFFAQGLEWKFVNSNLLSLVLRKIILSIYQSGCVITTNAYLSKCLSDEGINVCLEAPIWADPEFLTHDVLQQSIDFVMVLRKGDCKRLDLYLRFIALGLLQNLKIAVITPDDEIAKLVPEKVSEVLLRPDLCAMRSIYARSACFVHLSDHEGFGLPPLEAMGAGCIPICRDSGGVRTFMLDSPAADLLFPRSMSIDDIFAHAMLVLKDPALNERRLLVRKYFQLGLDNCVMARKDLLNRFSFGSHD